MAKEGFSKAHRSRFIVIHRKEWKQRLCRISKLTQIIICLAGKKKYFFKENQRINLWFTGRHSYHCVLTLAHTHTRTLGTNPIPKKGWSIVNHLCLETAIISSRIITCNIALCHTKTDNQFLPPLKLFYIIHRTKLIFIQLLKKLTYLIRKHSQVSNKYWPAVSGTHYILRIR